MDIGSIFLILAILLLATLYISRPLTRRRVTIISDEEQEYSILLADRDRILKTLRDLNFDYTLGKIPEELYPSERAELIQRGAAVLQKMDDYQKEKRKDDVNTKLALDSIQAEKISSPPIAINDDELEAMIANRIRNRQEKSNGFCPQCGHAIQQSDLFCPRCGHPLSDRSTS